MARSARRRTGDFRLTGLCLGALLVGALASVQAEDWPEWRGKGRLGEWNETGLVERFVEGGLPLKWRTPIHRGYAGPAVAGGRVFVTDSEKTKGNRVIERAIALDEETGKILWTRAWDADYTGLQLSTAIGPRATPTVDWDLVYALGAMGDLLALRVATGDVVWQKNFVKDFNTAVPAWGIAGAPIIDGDRIICLVGGEPDAKVMALNKLTGEEVWRALSSDSESGYSQPTIIDYAGVKQLIVFHPTAVSSLDPVTGKVYWEVPHAVEGGMTVTTPVLSGPYIFVSSQFGGSRLLKLDETKPGATLVWRGAGQSDRDYPSPNSLDGTITTAVIKDGYIYGLDGEGQLRCLELATGKQIWETEAVLKEHGEHGTVFFVKNGDRYFINNDRGELISATLSPKGYVETGRTTLIEPTHPASGRRELRAVLWSHAAYANKHIFIRNDKEIIRYSLAKE
jgi:outer membrane protein assembly factor BamB